jgi:hypothetical protein
MKWVLIIGAVWLVLAFGVAVLIGRGIRLADRKEAERRAASPNFVVDQAPPAPPASPKAPAQPEQARQSIPTVRPSAIQSCVPDSERTPSTRKSGSA